MADQYQHLREMSLVGVLAALGFTEWKSRKNGQEFYGPCPVHGSRKNNTCFSFHVDGRYRCFSCPAKGRGAIYLYKAVKSVNFQDAVSALQALQGQLPPEPPQTPAIEEAPLRTQNPAFEGKYEKYYVESAWLRERGFTEETLKRFGVGQYENPKRRSAYTGKVMIPILRFEDGCKVGYLARDIRPAEQRGSDPKYLFPKGVLKSLEVFGAWQIKNEVKQLPLRICYLVESPFAVMKFAQLGFPAVSPFGFSLSPEQVGILSQLAKGWVYLADRNKYQEAGPSVALLARTSWVRQPELPEGVDDPEQLSLNQVLAMA